uniref:Thioredoxin family protein n=1 Tax=Roseihalotalea indica TaxID=2867963 RepID=A0AA49JFW8_9BACT|nr:thioredoxin family protein [Tunicatimonas sp. TK19036]
MAHVVTDKHLEAGMSYSTYRQLIDSLLTEHKTTGNNQSEKYIEYTKLNMQRMRRLDKTTKLQPEVLAQLERINQPWIWIVLTEAWCGDAAQSLPVIAKMASAAPNIDLHLLLRDEYPEVMDAYLTNGGRSIPKLICLTQNLEDIGSWGPRPMPVQQMLSDYKEKYGDQLRDHYSEFSEQAQLWYARDRTRTIQQELKEKLAVWLESKPKL